MNTNHTMPIEFPVSVLNCFMDHINHVGQLPEASRNFFDSYLGVNILYIKLREYLCSPATELSNTKIARAFGTMEKIDSFVQNHNSLLPPTLSENCVNDVCDRSYFVHRGWGDMSLEDSIAMDMMTSFSFSIEVAKQFSFTDRVTTVKVTPDVLKNSLFVGEMAQVRTEDEILIFPGDLTRVGNSDLYTYTPRPSRLQDKIEHRRPQLINAFDKRKERIKEQMEQKAQWTSRREMNREEIISTIIDLYQSLSSGAITSLTVLADHDDLARHIKSPFNKGAIVENPKTDMDGVISGDVEGNPVKLVFNLKQLDTSELVLTKNGNSYTLPILKIIYRGREHYFDI